MAQFVAFDPKVEVNGQTVLAILDGVDCFKEKCINLLAKFGISNIQKDKWYSQQAWLNAFRIISENIGPYELYSIGCKIPENAIFQKNLNSMDEALNSINEAYKLNHRGGDIGYYRYINNNDDKIFFICKNPYPCEFDRGLIEIVAKKYLKDNQSLSVIHDDTSPCRCKGDDSCTYNIEVRNKLKKILY